MASGPQDGKGPGFGGDFEGDFGDWLIVKSSENDRIFTNLGAGALVLTPLSALFRMSAGSPQIAFTADLNNLLFVER